MTPQQREIIALCQASGGNLTKKQVVDEWGNCYHHNGAFHLGNILSRMVNNGMLVRVKPGVFKLGKGTKQNPSTIDKNQATLFEP